MRIEKVTAHAFGPLVDATLELAPGMTVITGVNESAKSSWHAASYSALVGRRRGKGAPTREERRFTELHKPWDGTDWRVSATISLDDGRRIELIQDLNGKVDCRALDLDLARDVSNEILFEGSPDASRFLGLDRKSFAATAVVNQAELLAILSAADGLQEHLQRAAATAGTDATAAAALTALEKFAREHVGHDRSNSTRPLRAAQKAAASAEAALTAALDEHESYLRLVTESDTHQEAAAAAATVADAQEKAVAARERLLACVREVAEAERVADHAAEKASAAESHALSLLDRVERAGDLREQFGDAAPTGAGEADGVSQAVAAALAGWATAPSPRALSGRSLAELQAELDGLPQPPEGDTEPAPAVRNAATAHAQAVAVAAAHAEQEPVAPVVPVTVGPEQRDAAIAAGPAVVRELAAALDAAAEPVAGTDLPALTTDLTEARARHEQLTQALTVAQADERAARAAHDDIAAAAQAPQAAVAAPTGKGRRSVLLLVAGLTAAAAVALLVAGQVPAGVVALVVAAALGGVAARTQAAAAPVPEAPSRPDAPDLAQAAQRVQDAARAVAAAQQDVLGSARAVAALEGRMEAEQAAARRAASALADVHARCAASGLPADAAQLRTLAAVAEQLADFRARQRRWVDTGAEYAQTAAEAEARLRTQLAGHGVPAGEDQPVAQALAAYERACADRAAQAELAARRPELTRRLESRAAAEDDARAAAQARERAVSTLATAATAAGLSVPGGEPNPTELVRGLERWQAAHARQLAELDAAQRGWADLQALLDGMTFAELVQTCQVVVADRDELRERAAAASETARRAAAVADQAAVDAGLDPVAAADVETAEKFLTEARHDATAARTAVLAASGAAENAVGVAAERARCLASVPEAEEKLSAAQAELERVTELNETLQQTQRFLASAQERVHRDIAPVLAGTLARWLPQVTHGRYIDASVDPATLQVQVTGPGRRWRNADRLSIGTAEQVYLLLRVALAQHLATAGETCPLLLDDVTVQADDERTREVLDLLLGLAGERQVVLFAQEPIVAAWAREHLAGSDRHAVIELERVATT